ncbi:MAG: hypothetical protein ACREFP_24740 [Acetobacteraceae bacterium]
MQSEKNFRRRTVLAAGLGLGAAAGSVRTARAAAAPEARVGYFVGPSPP